MAAARQGLPFLVSPWQCELEFAGSSSSVFCQHFLAVMRETALIFLHKFTNPERSLFDTVWALYRHTEDLYLSELTKSVNGAGLVHFSLEVLG